MYGWTGKFLRVDLTKSKITIENTDPKIARDFIGARGMGAKYLYDESDPKIDAYSPDNKLLMVTGPLTGTGAPAANRYMVVTKSPLTGAITNSCAGGEFATNIKYAGYDMIIFEGKAKKPTYLWIDNDTVELKDARHLWGKTTSETESTVINETSPEAKVACIGPGGERLARFACIMSDLGRAAGRSGIGAVMGSKNLKAIAVRGTKGIKIADKDGFYKAIVDSYNLLRDCEFLEITNQLGTPNVVGIVESQGILATRHFQAGVNPDWPKFSGEALADYAVRKGKGVACPACPVGCGRITNVTVPEFAGFGAGPEFQSIAILGSNCGVSNIAAIAKAGFICNEMGIDTISAGVTIACAMELYEKGYIPEKDIGKAMKFGDANILVEMIEKAGLREGFGDILAEGSYRLAEKYGHPELFQGVKKQEFPAYDPRGLVGLALNYATVSRGGCHTRGDVGAIDGFEMYHLRLTRDRNIFHVDRFEPKGKAQLTKDVQDWYSIVDSSGMCNFIFNFAIEGGRVGVNEDQCQALLETATGVNLGGYNGFMKTGDRIFNQERLFNLAAGLTGKDDTLPKRMLEEFMAEGPTKGHVVPLSEMLPEYYQVRGWDANGIPTPQKLKELGLDQS